MNKFKPYRIFDKAEMVIVKETNRRIQVSGRTQSKQGTLNDMILEYPVMLKKLKDLQK